MKIVIWHPAKIKSGVKGKLTFTRLGSALFTRDGAIFARPAILTVAEKVSLNIEAAGALFAWVWTARVDIDLQTDMNVVRWHLVW